MSTQHHPSRPKHVATPLIVAAEVAVSLAVACLTWLALFNGGLP